MQKIVHSKNVVIIIVLAAAYFAAAKLGLQLAIEHPSATAVWPPTGISIAALLLLGYRVWPGIAIGAFVANVTTAGTVFTSIGIAAGNTVEAFTATWLINKYGAGFRTFDNPRAIFQYVVFAAMLAPFLSATIGVLSLVLGQVAPLEQFQSIWKTWWLGDAVSAIVIAPVIMMWCTHIAERLTLRRIVELTASLAFLVVFGLVTFGVWLPWRVHHSSLAFLCIPPTLWLGFSFKQRGATLGMLVLSAVAVVGTMRGTGPFTGETANESLLLVQTFMGVIGITALIVASIVDMSQRALDERDNEIIRRKTIEAELETHQLHLQTLVDERTAALDESHKKLRFAERLASLGTLAAGLGHDMANLLLPLKIHVDVLGREKGEAVEPSVKAIGTTIEYLQRLASGLRLLSADPFHPTSGDSLEVREWWREAESVLRNTMRRGHNLEFQGPGSECHIAMSKPALTQIIFNLVQNATDAMRGSGTGNVMVSIECLNQQQVARVQVADNGPGMDEEIRRRCFEPFFTTKSRGISTGMGLALVHGLTTRVGGTIELKSEIGKGTTFTLRLPTVKPQIGQHKNKTASVDLNDSRMAAFVTAELQGRSYTVTTGGASRTFDLIVIDAQKLHDNPALCSSLGHDNRVIALGDGQSFAVDFTIVLVKDGCNPRALREAIDQIESA